MKMYMPCRDIPAIIIIQIQAGSGALIAGANLFVFGTIYSFFVFFARDDEWDWTTF